MPIRVPEGCEYIPANATTPEVEAAIRQLAYEQGETYSSYLVTEAGWETFWAPERTGAVRFVRWHGRYVLTVSGLLAPAEDQELLLARFREFLELNRLTVMFVNVGREQLPLYRAAGFQVTKCGEEPIVRLDKTTWQGKDYEWVRRQENFCKRQGLELVEVQPDPHDPIYCDDIAPQLEAISQEHVAATLHGRELGFFVGKFTPLDMGHKRLFVVRSDSRIEAFIICNPCLEGTMWAIEMYRKREDAPRGVIPFAMLQTMRLLKQEGVAYCSLSAIPMLRCEQPLTEDSYLVRGLCVLWWNFGNWLFDMRGIYHFKSRFRPDYREIYIVAWPRAGVLSMWAMGRTWGLIKFSPWRLLSQLVRSNPNQESRKTLAIPDLRPDRILRRLFRPAATANQAAEEVVVHEERRPTVAK